MFGESPRGVVATVPRGAAGRGGGMGGRRRSISARGTIATTQTTPIARCACRQPIVSTPHCSSGGQIVPAR